MAIQIIVHPYPSRCPREVRQVAARELQELLEVGQWLTNG